MSTVPYKYLKDENFQDFYPMIGESSFADPVSVASGGTGADTAAGARANLGAISATDAALVAGNVPFVLDVAEGGTGADNASDARDNLGLNDAWSMGTGINISSYNSSSNKYIPQYDGYVHINQASNLSTGCTFFVGDVYGIYYFQTIYVGHIIFVKKGIPLYAQDNSAGATIMFYPIYLGE